MQCRSCGNQLPVEVAYCPTCGAVTPYNVSHSGISPYDPTVASSSSGAPLPAPPPATGYGTPPYGVPQPNPYEPLNPYEAPLPQPLPPQPRRFPALLTALIVGLVLLLIGGSGLIYYTAFYQPNQMRAAQATSTAQALATTQAPINATATAEGQATAQAQATQTALQNIYNQATSGSPVLNDPLSSQDANNWDMDSNGKGSCAFTGKAYHSTAQSYYYPCLAEASAFNNFALQVQMTILKGDYGGIIFRASSRDSTYYYYRISQDGLYDLSLSVDNQYSHDQTLKSSSSSLINKGLNQPNQIAVIARGSNLYLYVNGKYLNQVTDSHYQSGKIGVFGGVFSSANTDVVFSNLQVWNL